VKQINFEGFINVQENLKKKIFKLHQHLIRTYKIYINI